MVPRSDTYCLTASVSFSRINAEIRTPFLSAVSCHRRNTSIGSRTDTTFTSSAIFLLGTTQPYT